MIFASPSDRKGFRSFQRTAVRPVFKFSRVIALSPDPGSSQMNVAESATGCHSVRFALENRLFHVKTDWQRKTLDEPLANGMIATA